MRYLFVPAPAEFADEYLLQPRRDGECVCLGADVPFRSDDNWVDLQSRFPAGWVPDVVVVWLADVHVPDCIWSAPVPVIGLVSGWATRGHYYRHLLPLCDAVFAPPPAVVALTQQGYDAVAVADLSGLGESALLIRPMDDTERDIDVLILDPLTLADPPDRARFAGRIAELSTVCRVAIRRSTTIALDRAWLARSKLVVQLPSPNGDERASYEAIAAGALPIRPHYPWDGPDWLRPGLDYAPYQDGNLEEVVLRLIPADADRRGMVRAGRARLREWQFANRLGRALAGLQPNIGELEHRATERAKMAPRPGLGGRVWAAIEGGPEVELPPPGGVNEPPEIIVVRGIMERSPAEAANHFLRAVEVEPDHPVAPANLAEALAAAGRSTEAIAAAKAALARLDRTAIRAVVGWDVPLYPPSGEASILWEAAAWANGPIAEANEKRAVLRWKLHLLIAGLTDDLSHYHEAALARSNWPAGRAALGCALARRGRHHEAVSHLVAASDSDPFDRPAARATFAALQDAGDRLGARLFARHNRRLCTVDPVGCPSEPWFADAGPVGDELATIVLLDIEIDPPRACLDAIFRHTRLPFEVIVVGSGDVEWLGDYQQRPGATQVAALRLAAGLPALELANRGIAEANGEFIAVIDSRTIVTGHWLDRLIARVCDHWPRVAACAPTISSEPAPQGCPTSPTDWAPRLASSLMVAHRTILDRVGRFDSTLGGFAMDDWCVRARQAGYALAIASDVRVQAINTHGTAPEFEAFVGRWGHNEGAAYRHDASGWARRPTVSACLIVRNEEAYLPDCLESIADLVDEIVIVDTGSNDRTREIATKFGARLFDFPWIDNFAAARNESIRRAVGDWVFWIDADDRLAEPDREAFRSLVAGLTFAPAAHVFKCVCLPDEPNAEATIVDHVRLFRNDPRLNWRYRVHEQILPAIRAIGMPVVWSPVKVTHIGYAAPGARDKKFDRDLRLLQLEDRDQPDDPFTLFNQGCLLLEVGRTSEALGYLNRSLDRSAPTDSIVRKLYAQIARCHGLLGHEEAILNTVVAGRNDYPDDAELLTLEASLRQKRGEWALAAACWKRLVEGHDDEHFASVRDGLRGESAHQGLATALSHLGRNPEPIDPPGQNP